MPKPFVSVVCLALLSTPAFADLTLRFDEGAPKDRFTLTNSGACPLGATVMTIDLSTAPAGLIFDVTGSGAGVSVFQPFEVVAGADVLTAAPRVLDGDTAVSLAMSGLAPGQSVAFTIDVDDTGSGSQTIVNGSEIAGVTLRAPDGRTATVGPDATARLVVDECVS